MTRYDMSGLPTFMPCISFFIRKYSCACKISTQPYRHLRVAGFYDMASRMAYITWTDLASWRNSVIWAFGGHGIANIDLVASTGCGLRSGIWKTSLSGVMRDLSCRTSVYQEMPKKCLSATFFKPFGCNIERIFPSMHFFLVQLFRRPHQYAFPRAF